jgi:excisionase family DNA binding protein
VPEILSVEQLSKFLGVPKSTIHGLTRSRGRGNTDTPIPFLKIGKRVYFRRLSVLAWLEAREAVTT